MARKSANGDDEALWDRVARGVRPLKKAAKNRLRAGEGGASVTKAEQLERPAPPKKARKTSPSPASSPAGTPPKSLKPGVAPGLDKRTGLRLRRGQIKIDARIDLHGLTQAEAHGALKDFIAASADRGRRCLLVITGKGSGALRGGAVRWFNEPDFRNIILAFAEAQPKHGGGGAYYVYLKKRRDP